MTQGQPITKCHCLWLVLWSTKPSNPRLAQAKPTIAPMPSSSYKYVDKVNKDYDNFFKQSEAYCE